jgi:hypothetical protein
VDSGETTNSNFIVFGLTRPGLEPTIYRTRGEQANHYATDAVVYHLMLNYGQQCSMMLCFAIKRFTIISMV